MDGFMDGQSSSAPGREISSADVYVSSLRAPLSRIDALCWCGESSRHNCVAVGGATSTAASKAGLELVGFPL